VVGSERVKPRQHHRLLLFHLLKLLFLLLPVHSFDHLLDESLLPALRLL